MNDTPTPKIDQPKNQTAQVFLAEVLQPPEGASRSSVSLTDYRAMCQGMLHGNVSLSDALLQERLEYIQKNSKLKQHFIPGYRYCPAVIPMSTFGNQLPDQEMANGDYLRTLVVDPSGQTVAGFSQQPTRIFDLLPQEVRDASFIIPGYESDEPHQITQKDRDMVAGLYEEAFRKLQALLS